MRRGQLIHGGVVRERAPTASWPSDLGARGAVSVPPFPGSHLSARQCYTTSRGGTDIDEQGTSIIECFPPYQPDASRGSGMAAQEARPWSGDIHRGFLSGRGAG